jgi:hypothetical protein
MYVACSRQLPDEVLLKVNPKGTLREHYRLALKVTTLGGTELVGQFSEFC